MGHRKSKSDSCRINPWSAINHRLNFKYIDLIGYGKIELIRHPLMIRPKLTRLSSITLHLLLPLGMYGANDLDQTIIDELDLQVVGGTAADIND